MFVTESLLASTIFCDELDIPFLIPILPNSIPVPSSSPQINQTPYLGLPTLFHICINALFAVLSVIDTTMFAFAVESTLTNGVGGMVLFASEYSILLATTLNAILRYGLSILDLRRARSRGGDNAPPWKTRAYLLKVTMYMTFFFIILTFYGLPLINIHDVFVTARSFITRLCALLHYHNTTPTWIGAVLVRTALGQLPPELSEAQLAALYTPTREAIEEQIRVLDGIAPAAFRCVEELTRVRSVLPGAVAVAERVRSEEQREGEGEERTPGAPLLGGDFPVGLGQREQGEDGSTHPETADAATPEERDG
ncbi:hypothetical protein BD413DRAFT_618106 [Trametes elegans]|nr:hypothetical protein BD413DRAFT_618106 [Trametes elegans]